METIEWRTIVAILDFTCPRLGRGLLLLNFFAVAASGTLKILLPMLNPEFSHPSETAKSSILTIYIIYFKWIPVGFLLVLWGVYILQMTCRNTSGKGLIWCISMFEIYLFLLVGVEEHASGIVCYRRFLSPETIWFSSNELTYWEFQCRWI